ncbi:MAG: hypothetical protein Q7K40_04230 [bacterium]|nr:hypothetical protein [bacterium]
MNKKFEEFHIKQESSDQIQLDPAGILSNEEFEAMIKAKREAGTVKYVDPANYEDHTTKRLDARGN